LAVADSIDINEFPTDWKGRKTYVNVPGHGVIAQCYTYYNGGYKLLPEYGGVPFDDKSNGSNLQVMRDIAGYKSLETGEFIGSRSAHRDHLRAHGLIEIGNERMPQKSDAPTRAERHEMGMTVKRTLEQLRARD
jgi:hypothetical protein